MLLSIPVTPTIARDSTSWSESLTGASAVVPGGYCSRNAAQVDFLALRLILFKRSPVSGSTHIDTGAMSLARL
ncbi:hypothetical protein GGI18_004163, partial [Coemansia linderi]